MKTCTRCRTVKPVGEFYRRADVPEERRAHCKACTRRTLAAYRAKNREACREAVRARRARERGQGSVAG